jgi:hypothetical protein
MMEELEANVREAVACHFAERKTPTTILLVKVLPNAFRFGSAKGKFTVPHDFSDHCPRKLKTCFTNEKRASGAKALYVEALSARLEAVPFPVRKATEFAHLQS